MVDFAFFLCPPVFLGKWGDPVCLVTEGGRRLLLVWSVVTRKNVLYTYIVVSNGLLKFLFHQNSIYYQRGREMKKACSPIIVMILTMSISLVFCSSLSAATCKGLSKSKCESNSDCSWVKSYKTKAGKSVDAYCRTKSGKGKKTSAATDTTKKSSSTQKTTDDNKSTDKSKSSTQKKSSSSTKTKEKSSS